MILAGKGFAGGVTGIGLDFYFLLFFFVSVVFLGLGNAAHLAAHLAVHRHGHLGDLKRLEEGAPLNHTQVGHPVEKKNCFK